MRLLRAIIDQSFAARGIAKRLLEDESFTIRTGLSELPSRKRTTQLQLRVGYVMSFFRQAESVFDEHPEISVDDKLLTLVAHRIKGLPHVRDPMRHATKCLYDIHAIPRWQSMNNRDKVTAACVRTFAEVEHGMRGIPVESVRESTVIDEIIKGVMREIHYDLR